MKSLVSLAVALLMLTQTLANNNTSSDKSVRNKRLLNVFQIVRFPNDPCAQSSSSRNGTCYTANECESRGGTSSSTCADGYGVCCVFSINCGATVRENCTYFESTGSETTGECLATVCRANDNICQFRLDFDQFVISSPTTSTASIGIINRGLASSPGNGVPAAAASRCEVDEFVAFGGSGQDSPKICGTNTGKHMYMDVSDMDECVTMNFLLRATVARWVIKVSQYPCDFENLAPHGCTEYYFTGATGTITTYNYADERRTIAGTTMTPKGRIQGCCGYGGPGTDTNGYDCVFIPGAATAGGSEKKEEICGRSKGLVTKTTGMSSTTICSNHLPFHVLFLSDDYEYTGTMGAALKEANAPNSGFQLMFYQDATNCP